MKTIVNISLMFILFLVANLFAQENKPDVLPEPIGGIEEIIKNVVYPASAKESGIEGKVLVKAIVDENGKVIKTEILKSVSDDCDKAAMDAIKKTKFTPALKDKKTVKAEVVIPIMFKLS